MGTHFGEAAADVWRVLELGENAETQEAAGEGGLEWILATEPSSGCGPGGTGTLMAEVQAAVHPLLGVWRRKAGSSEPPPAPQAMPCSCRAPEGTACWDAPEPGGPRRCTACGDETQLSPPWGGQAYGTSSS